MIRVVVDSVQQSQEETLPGELVDVLGRRSEILEAGSHLGRYLVLRRLGAGGMGEVYAAYDPTLDRQVALKLVRFDEGDGAEAAKLRLAREAQAMAKVRHPNVIVVHDVGTHEGRLYIAMELIEGTTLTQWLEDAPVWEAVLDRYCGAGEGLWAAHRRKVVHRDFKPENVMVDEDGRVVVLDFGLARAATGDAEPPSLTSTDELSNSLLDQGMTRAGTLPGTPAYMSPEQFAGAEANEFSDQFSFCVSLYQGLYGERPFSGDSTASLAFNISLGEVRPATSRMVPKWVRAAVLRGLSASPEDRWPSMRALLDALDSKRRKRRRLAFSAAGVGLLALALGATSASLLGRAKQCSGGTLELSDVWSDDVRQRADAHIGELQLDGLDTTWAPVRDELDAYASAWSEAHLDACEDTNVRKEQSAEAMDLRMGCLKRAKVGLEATVAEILEIDEEGAEHLYDLVAGLPELERCSDAAMLEGIEPPSPAVADRVESLRATLAQFDAALRRASATPDPLFDLESAVVAVDYPPLEAEFRQLLGDTLLQQQRGPEGAAQLETSLALSLARGFDELSIETLHSLVAEAQVAQNSGAAKAYAQVAVGLAQGDVSPRTKRLSVLAMARAQESAGEYDPAIETMRALLPTIPEDEKHERGVAYKDLGMIFETQERFTEARETYATASEELRAILGDGHTEIAHLEMLQGLVALKEGDSELAEKQFLRSLEINTAFYGEGHAATAGGHANLGTLYARDGRNEDALTQYEIVLDLIAEDDPRVAWIEQNLGTIALADGKYEEAARRFRRSIRITADAQGEDHPDVMGSHSTLGVTLEHLERPVEAESHHRTALALAVKAHGETHDRTTTIQIRLGHNLWVQGRTRDAIEVLEAARDAATAGVEPQRRAQMHFDLARAYWETGKRGDARASAKTALEVVESPSQTREIKAWLSAKG